MNIQLNKEKSIGKVLYIVEGGKTEPNILYSLFVKVYQALSLLCVSLIDLGLIEIEIDS